MMKLLPVFCVLLLSVYTVYATTYYVSIFGSDQNNGLTAHSAFETLKQSQRVAEDGDTIQLLPGIFEGDRNCIEWNKSNLTIKGPAALLCFDGMSVVNQNMTFQNISFVSFPEHDTLFVNQFSNTSIVFDHCLFSVSLEFNNSTVNISNSHFSRNAFISHVNGSINGTNCTSSSSGYLNSTNATSVFLANCSFPGWVLYASNSTNFTMWNSSFSSIQFESVGNNTNSSYCNVTAVSLGCSFYNQGLSMNNSNCTFNDVEVYDCMASFQNQSSAIYLNGSSANFTNLRVYHNFGNSAVFVSNSSYLNITNGTFSGNQGNQTTQGGAIHIANGGNVFVVNSTFSDNFAYEGGAFYLAKGGSMRMENSVLQNNVGFKAAQFGCERNVHDDSLHFEDVEVIGGVHISGDIGVVPLPNSLMYFSIN